MASARPYANAHRSRQITTPAPHHLVFYRPDALPAAQPTVSKHWRHITQKKIKEIKSKIRWKSCEPWKSYVCKHGVRVLHYWGHWQVKKIGKQTLPFDLVIFFTCLLRGCCGWRKLIKDVWWSGWVWVGECFFWYQTTRVVPNKGPLNSCVCYVLCMHNRNAIVGVSKGMQAVIPCCSS